MKFSFGGVAISTVGDILDRHERVISEEYVAD